MARSTKATSSRERAAALIIVLAFVVLLTGLALAYLSRATSDRQVAQSSFHQSKADQLAASGMDLIIGDLQAEIAHGSSPTPTVTPSVSPLPVPTASPFVYQPLSPANIVPVRWPVVSAVPNLVRISIRNDDPGGINAVPSPGVSSHASAVNSTNPADASANGRVINRARWNRHYLIPRPSPTPATDTSPILAFSPVPDWVIVTRNGPVAFSAWNDALKDSTQSNNSYCVGRYAYAIYDEGGLLDVNVAGHPTSSTASHYGPKGVSAFADLTVLGLSGSGNPNDVDAIVGWRNYFSARQSGNFPNFSLNAANFLAWALSNTNGFMSVAAPSPAPNNMSNTDQQFTTRQSLIQFLVSSGLSANAPDALEYLGTFSRELNAPSWVPTLNASDMGGTNGAGNIYAYKDNAANPTATTVNPDLLNVRVVNSFTRADGTTAAVGEPLIKARFPLTRLAGVTPTGTPTGSTILNGVLSPATAATVQRDFGLVWNATSNRWDYVGPTGSTVQTSIETLWQVANESPGREPNFFELLKAAILSGSVGMGSGSASTFVASQSLYWDTGDTTHGTSSDYQLTQIGANIINQWDSSNVPIFIGFGSDPSTSQPYEIAGIKNLPYLSKLVFKPYFSGGGASTTFEAWMLPSFWNPHQNAPPATQNVRLAFTSGTMTANTTSPNSTSSRPSPEFMTVDANNFGASPSAPTAVIGGAQTTANVTRTPDNPRYWGFHFTASTTGTPSSLTIAYPSFGSGCDFEMKVDLTGTGNWKTYQKWKSCTQPSTPLKCQSPASWSANLQDPEFVTLDPRTLRFGVWGNAGVQSGVAADYTDGTQGTLDWPRNPPNAARYEFVTALPPQGAQFASSTSPNLYLYANNSDATVRYTDLDGVQRLGDFISGTTTAMLPSDSADRPLILAGGFQNGVFQSVAELGHVFRDQPWKTLTFTTAMPSGSITSARSADAGLLDVFTLHESTIEAGKVSLNTKQPSVLKAILSGAIKRLNDSTTGISSSETDNIVTALTNLTASQPMVNKAELVTRLAADSSVTGLGNKEARECVLRAFSDAGQTRTWNLLIDLIAQSGRYPPNANSLAGFMIEGETHYWVHVAIDRFTGQVIDKQIEVVNE
jgi:hypothetical protein